LLLAGSVSVDPDGSAVFHYRRLRRVSHVVRILRARIVRVVRRFQIEMVPKPTEKLVELTIPRIARLRPADCAHPMDLVP
jgi:hypothetical protein